ncbi:MAG TPA: UvrD-helicase domain-containing protein, partial [Flavobacteriaceae bacterium]|nr:UvrD-helicase domain-containing protein [Flavobacteriaceae bacterium]
MPQLAPFTIYNASAGSGKTFTLVKEYLKILLRSKNQEAFKHILAITFTNKAVGEMKLRLIETLKQFSQTSILEQPNTMFTLLCEELNLDAKTLHLKSKTVLDAILHNYGAFDISTIDRFTHKIIRTFAKDLKLSLNFEVELDVDNLLNQAVDNLIAKAGSDKLLTKTLVDFALEKVDDDKSWDVSYDLNSIAKLLVKENDLPYLEALKHKSLEDFKALKESLTETISKAEKQIIESAQNVLDFIAECGLEHSDFSSGYLPKHFGNLSNGNFDIKFDNKWQQEIESKALYPARVKGSEALTMDRIQPQLVKAFYQTRDAVYQWGFYKAVYRNITPLSVLNAINQELEQIKLDENKVLISEFNSIISSEIKNQPTPFIYERLGEKFKHYFIDEFQDTSKMQWQNLRPLIANAIEQEQVGQNGSLMLVGDAKQAIYRWRGGEAEQFIDLYNKAVEPFHLEPKVENLDYNFRSFQEVIKFNNAFFEYLSRNAFENLDYGHLYQQSKQHAYHKEDGCVSLQFLSIERDDDKDLLYCDQVYKTVISCLENGYSQSDLCVLVRKNEQGVAVSNYLAEKGLRIISSESMLLNNSPQVRFLNDLLTLLVQPKNMEVKVSILYFLAKQFQITDIHAFISVRLQLSFEVLVRDLEQYNIQLQTRDLLQQTLFDTVETLARAFHLTKTSNAYIQFYLDTVLEFSERNTNDMASFLDYFDKKKEKLSIVSSEGQDAIRVMTIHKSKGLEFPVVIFPYAELNIYKEVSPKEWFPLEAEK